MRNDTVGSKPDHSSERLLQRTRDGGRRDGTWQRKQTGKKKEKEEGWKKERGTRVSQAVIIDIGSAIVGEMYSSSATRKSKWRSKR